MKKTFDKSTTATPTDEVFFSQYLEGNSNLSELYQSSDSQKPSSELDKNILSAAKDAVNTSNKSWWTQPSSWAASIALFSLVGLLAVNTWQAEQQLTEEAILPQAAMEAVSTSNITADMTTDMTEMDSMPSLARKKKSKPKAKVEKSSIDTRKLRFDSNPMPKMQATPSALPSAAMKYQQRVQFNNAPALSEATIQNIIIPEQEILTHKNQHNTDEAEQKLVEIKQFINNGQLNNARHALQQLQKKYPNYPIDPVILQHLSPH
ncbi:hypothetical protein [sulfur-oxidizing endosymbiont of Gigantopelta aegis]|uniref:hypothetical protein n=1 Tax=sulfur-oxidizing endosymbiont of Gigantopelta aegis TaxID=2794934 RepID=UPI0018DCFEAF|nr:hypothetical protein [sulfur-oxidizing endosymbiont of Gigantopelta aegis]